MGINVTVKEVTDVFKEKIVELQEEPEFQWNTEKIRYAVDDNGDPCVKLAVGNVPLDYDLWKGLRNPATVGLYPVGLQEIWEFYANRRRETVDEFGRQTIFKVPRSFNFACKNYTRAVIISVMLPFSPKVIEDYTQLILKKRKASSHLFSRMYKDVNLMIDKATARVAIELVADDNIVVMMSNDTVKSISMEAVPLTRQGDSNGPSKGGNYPQKSMAVLMGLGQFGVSRIVFRDEFIDGKVQRFIGPIRSVVIFDKENLVTDGSSGIIYPTETWRKFLFKLFDFTNIDDEINQYRFCSYIPYNDEGCNKCVAYCPTGAQENSIPSSNGRYSEQILKQTHRFWSGKLQFDFARCREKREQMTILFSEWSCARGLSVCAAVGKRRMYAAKNFYKKMFQLTKDSKVAILE